MVEWNATADVVVVGTGAGALTAAILAHDQGARTVMIERSDKVGGTSAVSGGAIWIPMNSHMAEIGVSDSREEALAYCKAKTGGRAPDELVETYVDTGHVMQQYLEDKTPLKFAACTMPDYNPELPGGKPEGGRMLDPVLFNKNELGEWADKLRPAPIFFLPMTVEELFNKYQGNLKPQNLPGDLIAERMQQGLVGSGNALVGALLKGCLDRGIHIVLETRARRLIQENGRVIGIQSTRGDQEFNVRAERGVILASGGFEWNPDMTNKFLPGPIYPNSPPHNQGDALRMCQEIGADIANMGELWGHPAAIVPGEEYDDRPLHRLVFPERIAPHSILVNRQGRRFVNESANYNDMNKAFHEFDANANGYKNLPAWSIMDQQYRNTYNILTVLPDDPDPDWLIRADSLAELAEKAGIDAEVLEATVQRFNEFAAQGRDPDFKRGDSVYDRWMGDSDAPHPNLGTIEKPPFYALQVYPGALGTKGGPRVDVYGRVLHLNGDPIPGLYATSNAIASVAGSGYYGGGGTIGPSMVFGYLAGIHAAEQTH